MDKRNHCYIVEMTTFPSGDWHVYTYTGDSPRAGGPTNRLCPATYLRDFIARGTTVTILEVIWTSSYVEGETLARKRKEYWLEVLEHSTLLAQESNHG